MEQIYLVGGATWIAEVVIDEDEFSSIDDMRLEIVTRGVEAFLGKRNDITVWADEGLGMDDAVKGDPVCKALHTLITTELVPGCGIGTVLFLTKYREDGAYVPEDEMFMNSRTILSNVGAAELVKRFDEKHPGYFKNP